MSTTTTSRNATNPHFVPTKQQERWLKHFQTGFIGNVVQVLSITMAIKTSDGNGEQVSPLLIGFQVIT
jgi:hypothetical protein